MKQLQRIKGECCEIYLQLFITLPVQLWNLHRENMSEDILHKTRITVNNMDLDYNGEIFNNALLALEDKIKALGGTDLKVFGLPEVHRDINNSLNYEIIRETCYNIHQLTSYIETNVPNLTDDQRLAFEKITSAVFTETGGISFLDAPGGTGKTYLINLLLAKIRQRNLIALAVASSGIAAALLTGGRTAHSVFKLPINLSFVENPVCNISRSSDRAKLLKKCKLNVWDECTMTHKLALEALNTAMQDIFQNNKCMGETMGNNENLVLSGNFRQTLPIIPRGTKADEMNASIKASYIWKNVQRCGLKTNMRFLLTGDISTEQLAQNLLHLGNGTMTIDSEGLIALTNIGNIVATIEDLQDRIFPNIESNFRDINWLCERSILSPTNEGVKTINYYLFRKLPGEIQIFKSFDTVIEINQAVNYPT
ncbi:ATP-dependent DNA helicase pif1-like isoform X2 [Argiope bruennichi]|uniref:ATP-dependent DNA helicase pif1-like isoform X2 n=1 Tax=Argiope bruennichi TaxID=94029 RepID=UPI00249509EE|nr:ATP-dependent DNA helicase pif1-like isoform X2 [Argiope bruennichi]